MGPIEGVVATADDLPATGAAQGALYYVEADESLYVWDAATGSWTAISLAQGPRGATGATGADGAPASSYMIIPFSSQEAPLTYAINGEPSRVSLLGYGYGDGRGSGLGVADYSIDIDPSDGGFSLTEAAGNSNLQSVFTLPFDASVRSIYITVGNYASFSPNFAVFPYVQLYSAPAGSNSFLPIEGALAVPETGIGPGTDVPADTMRAAQATGLDILLPAGTRLAICAMMRVPGHTGGTLEYWLYFTGGVGLSYAGL